MKRVSVALLVALVLMFAAVSTTMARVISPPEVVTNLEMKQFVKDVYGWELAKSCSIEKPVLLPAGKSVKADYTVTAARIKEETSCTVQISADIGRRVKKVKVTYGDESRWVKVKDDKISETFDCQDGITEASLGYKAGRRSFKVHEVELAGESVFRETVNATATLQDQFGPLPDGLAVSFPGEYQPERELSDETKELYEFHYTVTVANLSSYGETHTLANKAILAFGEDNNTLERTTLFEIVTPEYVDKKLEDQKPEPKPEKEPLLPQTQGGHSVPGLLGVLMTAAGILIRRFK